MICTLFKLFSHKIGEFKCQGTLQTLQDLNTSALSFLTNNFISTGGKEVTLAGLIINKITGENVDINKVGLVDICDGHKQKLTILHKSLKQKLCAIVDCNGKGRTTKKRISFGASLAIFQRTSQLVPAGSILCL